MSVGEKVLDAYARIYVGIWVSYGTRYGTRYDAYGEYGARLRYDTKKSIKYHAHETQSGDFQGKGDKIALCRFIYSNIQN